MSRRQSERFTAEERALLDKHIAKAIADGKLTVCRAGEALGANETETVKQLRNLQAGKPPNGIAKAALHPGPNAGFYRMSRR